MLILEGKTGKTHPACGSSDTFVQLATLVPFGVSAPERACCIGAVTSARDATITSPSAFRFTKGKVDHMRSAVAETFRNPKQQ
jgi:hypothetical protein